MAIQCMFLNNDPVKHRTGMTESVSMIRDVHFSAFGEGGEGGFPKLGVLMWEGP